MLHKQILRYEYVENPVQVERRRRGGERITYHLVHRLLHQGNFLVYHDHMRSHYRFAG